MHWNRLHPLTIQITVHTVYIHHFTTRGAILRSLDGEGIFPLKEFALATFEMRDTQMCSTKSKDIFVSPKQKFVPPSKKVLKWRPCLQHSVYWELTQFLENFFKTPWDAIELEKLHLGNFATLYFFNFGGIWK